MVTSNSVAEGICNNQWAIGSQDSAQWWWLTRINLQYPSCDNHTGMREFCTWVDGSPRVPRRSMAHPSFESRHWGLLVFSFTSDCVTLDMLSTCLPLLGYLKNILKLNLPVYINLIDRFIPYVCIHTCGIYCITCSLVNTFHLVNPFTFLIWWKSIPREEEQFLQRQPGCNPSESPLSLKWDKLDWDTNFTIWWHWMCYICSLSINFLLKIRKVVRTLFIDPFIYFPEAEVEIFKPEI